MGFHGLVIHRLLDSLFGMVWMSASLNLFFEFFDFENVLKSC